MTNLPESAHTSVPASSGASPQATWWWRLENSSGQVVAVDGVARQEFPSQSDAETWVGEVWEEMLEGGADAVTLFEGDREVYGPMNLRPA
ncbi:MAG: hypothetical protein M3393_05665 [Actinomycetota bacterium]|nr:hypothetical protein [Actinomycetota bacterium]